MRENLHTAGLMRPDDPALDRALSLSVPGMAHFGGSGPEGLTCRSCANWGESLKFRRKSKTGILCGRKCARFTRMMQGKSGPAVPHQQAACRHFEPRADVPEAVRLPQRKGKAKA